MHAVWNRAQYWVQASNRRTTSAICLAPDARASGQLTIGPSVATDFMLNLIAYNLIRIPKLLAA
jgi:hypothetical protein